MRVQWCKDMGGLNLAGEKERCRHWVCWTAMASAQAISCCTLLPPPPPYSSAPLSSSLWRQEGKESFQFRERILLRMALVESQQQEWQSWISGGGGGMQIAESLPILVNGEHSVNFSVSSYWNQFVLEPHGGEHIKMTYLLIIIFFNSVDY